VVDWWIGENLRDTKGGMVSDALRALLRGLYWVMEFIFMSEMLMKQNYENRSYGLNTHTFIWLNSYHNRAYSLHHYHDIHERHQPRLP